MTGRGHSGLQIAAREPGEFCRLRLQWQNCARIGAVVFRILRVIVFIEGGDMRSVWWRVAGLWLALSPLSCGPAASNSMTSAGKGGADSGEPTATAGSDGTRGLRVRPNVATFPGRWGLVMIQPQADQQQRQLLVERCLALVDITGDGADMKGTVLATVQKEFELKIDRVAVDGPKIEIDFTGSGIGRLEYRGELSNGLVRGTAATSGGMQPAYLKPTEESTFEGWDFSPLAPGMEVLQHAVQQKDQPAAILTAAKELRGNPLSLELYHGVMQRLGNFSRLTEDQLREIAADYASSAAMWGSRMELQARMMTATTITTTRRYPNLALELSRQIEELSDKPPNFDDAVKVIREQAEIDLALQKLRSQDEAAQATGFAELQALLPNQRYNPELLHVLGEHLLKTDQKDAAVQYFAEIVALPMLEASWFKSREGQPPGDPSPRDRLLSLWKEKHGNTDSLEAHLVTTYNERLHDLLEQVQTSGGEPAAEAGSHVVLVELFTGVYCPPCVAADLALSALRRTHPSSRLVAIQYHQHIPLPDQLCNQDSEDRLGYYSVGGTPTLVLDGFLLPPDLGVGGMLQNVQQSYSILRPLVDERLKVASEVAISATAAASDGELTVEATVTGVPADVLPQTRLRLALVEDHVHLAAPNGIREHEFVVREMLGGAKGTGPKSGKLGYTLQMPLAELKQHLVDYLNQFEAGRNVDFDKRPLELKPLSLVAWVQNEQTHEILQTILVPVTGELVYPADEAEEDPVSAATPANAP
jgi:hypothetical protein